MAATSSRHADPSLAHPRRAHAGSDHRMRPSRDDAAKLPNNAVDDEPASPSKAPILAQRFRTKLCNKFATTGSCPYVHRCMFAHFKDELRTAGQNVADGLVSEEAIRTFKREQYEARMRAEALAVKALVPTPYGQPRTSLSPAAPPFRLSTSAAAGADGSQRSDRRRGSSRGYRHDPYAEASKWHPLGESADDDDDAEDGRFPAAAPLLLMVSAMERSVESASIESYPRWPGVRATRGRAQLRLVKAVRPSLAVVYFSFPIARGCWCRTVATTTSVFHGLAAR